MERVGDTLSIPAQSSFWHYAPGCTCLSVGEIPGTSVLLALLLAARDSTVAVLVLGP